MSQIKIYGERQHLNSIRSPLSNVIHAAVTTCLGLPADKRFHRFIGLDKEDFYYPEDRTAAYTIIEISLFKGRSDQTKRALLKMLMETIPEELNLGVSDLEITLFETPKSDWGIRGMIGDELPLVYEVQR